MKKLISFAVLLLALTGCYNYSALWDAVNSHEQRIARLERNCADMNNNLTSLTLLMEALRGNDFITGVSAIVENGVEIGYELTFAKSGTIKVYHTDSDTIPVLCVREDEDGIFYWTLNGEWILDDDGNKLPAAGPEGAAGITPQLKIEEDYWYVSYDEGTTWEQLGKASGEDGEDGKDGEDGDSLFMEVTEDEDFVYLTLADGTILNLPKRVSLGIEFDQEDLVVLTPDSSREVAYKITSHLPAVVEVLASGDVNAKVIPDAEDAFSGVIVINSGAVIDEYCKVIVLVSNGEKVIMRTLALEKEAIDVEDAAEVLGGSEGGEVELPYISNVSCSVDIPEEAQSWISVAADVDTKAMERRSIRLVLEPNNGPEREAVVVLHNDDRSLTLEFRIYQKPAVTHIDGYVETLQLAETGNGIDIVLMGDAYTADLIADNTYRNDMVYMYNNLFTEEPFNTFRNLFNVYYVNVVSETAGYDTEGETALEGFFGEGTLVGGSDSTCFKYAMNALTEERVNEALIIVAMNSDRYAGTCYMYFMSDMPGDYGSGPSIAYFPKGDSETMFAQLLHHEACGHGFSKLSDEYAYEDYGQIPDEEKVVTESQQDEWGWWKNIDFTSDTLKVRWAHFLADERYQNEGLGCFEGGNTYWTGVWRPTENSIMRYNYGGFNAPSREAIYYRIHKLAYGADWEYDYEAFVKYDEISRSSSMKKEDAQGRINYVERAFVPTAPPVVVSGSWKDLLR